MKKIANILMLGLLFITMASCKSAQIHESVAPNSEPPEVEFDLGQSSFPKLEREVSDYELIFTVEELEKLTLMIREFEKETSNQIAIVSIKSIGDYTDFNKYALDLSNFAGVGLKNKNNGLTIIFSKQLRKIRISTGIGTENILTDEVCQRIIDEMIIPEFKKGNYYNGIEKGLIELIKNWQ